MDLESQDPIFNANLGQDENLIWTKKLRCSHSIRLTGQAAFTVNAIYKPYYVLDSIHPCQQTNHYCVDGFAIIEKFSDLYCMCD